MFSRRKSLKMVAARERLTDLQVGDLSLETEIGTALERSDRSRGSEPLRQQGCERRRTTDFADERRW